MRANFAAQIRAFEMRASMSRKGDCRDNAVAGSLFGSPESESLNRHDFGTRRAASDEIMAWIATCDQTRRHSTPATSARMQFEQTWLAGAPAKAASTSVLGRRWTGARPHRLGRPVRIERHSNDTISLKPTVRQIAPVFVLLTCFRSRKAGGRMLSRQLQRPSPQRGRLSQKFPVLWRNCHRISSAFGPKFRAWPNRKSSPL